MSLQLHFIVEMSALGTEDKEAESPWDSEVLSFIIFSF